MATESTKGDEGTVGDVGLTLPDGRFADVSLKASSKLLHNGGPAKVMETVGLGGWNPYEDEAAVKAADERAFQAAGSYLRAKLHEEGTMKFTYKQEEWALTEDEEGRQYLAYHSPKKQFTVPLEAFESLEQWKKLGKNEQKVLSYFITANSRAIAAEAPEYLEAAKERQSAINGALLREVGKSEACKRAFAARMMGLRNREALYANYTHGQLHTGAIPTIEAFTQSERYELLAPVENSTGIGVIIPIRDRETKKVSLLSVRTRFADGQFNYSDTKMTGEYIDSAGEEAYLRAQGVLAPDDRVCKMPDVVFSEQ